MRSFPFVIVAMSVASLPMTCLAQQTVFEQATPNSVVPVGAVPLPSTPIFLESQPMAPFFGPTTVGSPLYSTGFTLSSGGGDDFGLLHDASVRKDLEILDEQMKRFTEVESEYREKISVMVNEHQEQGGFNTREGQQEYARRLQELQNKQREAIQGVLLPHQLDRFKQVSRQWKMQMMGMANVLHHGSLSEELEISKSQKARLREIEKEFRRELAKKVKEMTEAAEQRMLDELSSEQREKLRELTGDEFKQDAADWATPAIMDMPVEEKVEKLTGESTFESPALSTPPVNSGDKSDQ
jgi:plasmid maintenance system killer protein